MLACKGGPPPLTSANTSPHVRPLFYNLFSLSISLFFLFYLNASRIMGGDKLSFLFSFKHSHFFNHSLLFQFISGDDFFFSHLFLGITLSGSTAAFIGVGGLKQAT